MIYKDITPLSEIPEEYFLVWTPAYLLLPEIVDESGRVFIHNMQESIDGRCGDSLPAWLDFMWI